MDLPKVEGTQIRGTVYHLNLRIKPEIQDLYGGKSHLRGSLRTSDPEVARREVDRHRAELHQKEQERARQAEVEDLVSQLSPEKRAAYDAAGGLEGLLEGFEQTRAGSSPAAAGAPGSARVAPPSIDEDGPLGDDSTGIAPVYDGSYDDFEEKPFTLADLLEEYLPTVDYEKAEALRHIVRLFTEFHGDIAFEELTITDLDEFAEAVHGLPADMKARLADGTFVRDLPFAEMVAWTVHAEARPISETARFQYVVMLKELMDFGVPKYRRGDPWSDYRLQIQRRESVEPLEKKPARLFTPKEWTFSDAMLRLLEVAIGIFMVLVFILLWQARH